MARSLDGIAATDAGPDGATRAAMLLGAADGIRDTLGAGAHPIDRPTIESTRRDLRAALGVEMFERALADGRALSPEAVIHLVDASATPTPRPEDAADT
jgi:hypothetical protein